MVEALSSVKKSSWDTYLVDRIFNAEKYPRNLS